MASDTPGSRGRKKRDQIDVAAILTKPVKVSQNGRERRMAPYEIELRALVKKAVKENSLNAIRTLIEVGLKHDVVKLPLLRCSGGVLVVHGRLTKESWAALFEAPQHSNIENDKKRK
jgi:hypothetical protein